MARRLSSNLQLQKETTLKPLRQTNIRNISWSRVELVCSGAVFLVALLLYTLTLAPTVTLVDSGELIVAAWGLGVAHPPGFPLWVMLAHLASMLPVGNVAARINFSSAFFGALACAIGTLVVAELQITDSFVAAPRRQNKAAQQSRKIEDSTDRFFIFAPAVGAGLLMTFSRTLWCMLRSPRSILSTRY
ncbi:MAG TPA: DUF2723 domain-containing protein [Candidatus Udaeobacter sp.]|nr:DUF2723 domain-containing protein [Candidatus Udaeobacter sp.]